MKENSGPSERYDPKPSKMKDGPLIDTRGEIMTPREIFRNEVLEQNRFVHKLAGVFALAGLAGMLLPFIVLIKFDNWVNEVFSE